MAHIAKVISHWDPAKYQTVSDVIGQDIAFITENGDEELLEIAGRLYGMTDQLSHGFWRNLYHDIFPEDWSLYNSVQTTSPAIKNFMEVSIGYRGYFRTRTPNVWNTLLLNRLVIRINRAEDIFTALKAAEVLSKEQALYITKLAPVAVFLLAETYPEIANALVDADYLDYEMLSWDEEEATMLLDNYSYWTKIQKAKKPGKKDMEMRKLAYRSNILQGLLNSGRLTRKQELSLLPAMFRHGMKNEIESLLPHKVKNPSPLLSAAVASGDIAMVELAMAKAPKGYKFDEVELDVPDTITKDFLIYLYTTFNKMLLQKLFTAISRVYTRQERYDLSLLSDEVLDILNTVPDTLVWEIRSLLKDRTSELRRKTRADYNAAREQETNERIIRKATWVQQSPPDECPHCEKGYGYIYDDEGAVCRSCAQTVSKLESASDLESDYLFY